MFFMKFILPQNYYWVCKYFIQCLLGHRKRLNSAHKHNTDTILTTDFLYFLFISLLKQLLPSHSHFPLHWLSLIPSHARFPSFFSLEQKEKWTCYCYNGEMHDHLSSMQLHSFTEYRKMCHPWNFMYLF